MPERLAPPAAACDPDGELRRARRLADRALALARTPAERFSAARLQLQLAYEAGDGRAGARAARLLLVLDPGGPEARTALRRWPVPSPRPARAGLP